ncbi:mCG146965 [Mus musculus]|nr:mCG146965 [Mus musculus]
MKIIQELRITVFSISSAYGVRIPITPTLFLLESFIVHRYEAASY